MGVHDHIGDDAFPGEGQIFLSVGHSTSSLLSVATREFVSNLRDFDGAHLDFSKALIVLVGGKDDLINDARLSTFKRD